ncbi:MAG TPA: glycosyltransferase [bacterium]|nr:glycosyltransferase [bacterium]
MEATRVPEVSVIIVSYDTKQFIGTCLRALAARTGDVTCEVIVLDNASRDGSAAMIEQEFPWVVLVKNPTNLGYAKAVNKGIRLAKGRYFLVLNPDVEVGDRSVASMVAFMERNRDVGIAGAKLLYPDGTLQMSCRTFYTLPIVLLRRTPVGKLFPDARIVREHLMLDWDHNSEREVDWVLGACMMVRRSAYESVGGMDERFFLYLEDVDWCYRMNKHGWRVAYVPSAVMKHYHRRESARMVPDRKLVSHLLSTFRFYDKWNPAVFGLKRERRMLWLIATLVADLVLVNFAFIAAYYLRSAARGVFTKPLYGLGIYKGLMVFVNVVCLFSLVYSGFYRRRRSTTFVRDLVGISRALLFSSLVIMAATYLTRTVTYSRLIILIFWPLSALLVTFGRAVGRLVHAGMRQGFFDLRRTLIVGEDSDAVDLKSKLVASRRAEYDFVGYVGPAGREVGPELRPALGDTRDISRIVTEHRIGDVFVCDKRLSRAEVGSTVVAARRAGAEVKVVSEVTDILIHGSQLEDIEGVPFVVFPPASLSGARLVTKRVSDLVLSILGIALAAAVSPLVAVYQTLTYRNYAALGRVFKCLGLVIAGQSSLAGPSRPISGERLKPGVISPGETAENATGEDRDRIDIYYIQNWSLSYDLELVLGSLKGIWNLFRKPASPARP